MPPKDQRNHTWTNEIPDEQWMAYEPVLIELDDREIPYSLGGAFALASYTLRWRNTKDLDIYIRPQDREIVISILQEKGFDDYYQVLPYVREWIYRSYKDDFIVDIIWSMANQRTDVDEGWFDSGERIPLRGNIYCTISPGELIWAKVYVLQKERTDWPDVLNVIHAVGPEIDWERLLDRFGTDLPLLSSVLSIFEWLDPERAHDLPGWLWDRLHLPEPENKSSLLLVEHRASLLDSRPWFQPLLSTKNSD